MALRFRKSVKLAPGIRLNFGKRGMSLTAGVSGASVTFGSRGTYANVGIPGTGISFRERIDRKASRQSSHSSADYGAQRNSINTSVKVKLHDDGTIEFLDGNGQSLPLHLERIVKQQQGGFVREWLKEECHKSNRSVEVLEILHLETPPPDQRLVYTQHEFTVEPPLPPEPEPLGISARLFKRIRTRIEQKNEEALHQHAEAMKEWEKQKAAFEAEEMRRKRMLEEQLYTSPAVMQAVLEEQLQGIDWPRETNVSFEVVGTGQSVYLDVDLPEIEDLPAKMMSAPSRGWQVKLKRLSDTKIRKIYMNHVYGIGFRLTGETFATLPTVNKVILSAYSQRLDRATGNVADEYLYSVEIHRSEWEKIDFGNLPQIDLPECLGQFNIRRKMTKTGVFTPIEPFSAT